MSLCKSFDSGLRKICARTSAPWVACIYKINAAGGTGGSATIVMVFGRLFVLFVQSPNS
jgi:hypothetical protein